MSADLQVTLTDGANNVVPGAVDTYTIVVTNFGPDPVTSVTLTDVSFPALLGRELRPLSRDLCRGHRRMERAEPGERR
jgi:Domain of unknown function DUF11